MNTIHGVCVCVLQELANATGNILENKELLDSLNKTKASSITISESLDESVRLQASLDSERNSYIPLAQSGSSLYFVITDLAKINNMYRFSLAAFLGLFQRALETKHVSGAGLSRYRASVGFQSHPNNPEVRTPSAFFLFWKNYHNCFLCFERAGFEFFPELKMLC